MALGTLAELRTAALMLRSDLTSRFGEILALAEQRMKYGGDGVPPLRVLPMEKNAALVFTNGSAALPADFLDKRALYWEGTYTVPLSYEPPSMFYPASNGRVGASYPEAYTIEGETVKIGPELSGTAKLLYWSTPGALTADGSTNDVLEKWPGVYLFGCQAEVHRITRDTEEQAKCLRMYADAVTAANNQTIAARSFGGPLRRRVGFSV